MDTGSPFIIFSFGRSGHRLSLTISALVVLELSVEDSVEVGEVEWVVVSTVVVASVLLVVVNVVEVGTVMVVVATVVAGVSIIKTLPIQNMKSDKFYQWLNREIVYL